MSRFGDLVKGKAAPAPSPAPVVEPTPAPEPVVQEPEVVEEAQAPVADPILKESVQATPQKVEAVVAEAAEEAPGS